MLASQHRGDHVIAHADAHVQASAEVWVPQEAHGTKEEPLLALKPEHRCTGVLLVHGIDKEVDWRHGGNHLGDGRGKLRPRWIVEVSGERGFFQRRTELV